MRMENTMPHSQIRIIILLCGKTLEPTVTKETLVPKCRISHSSPVYHPVGSYIYLGFHCNFL